MGQEGQGSRVGGQGNGTEGTGKRDGETGRQEGLESEVSFDVWNLTLQGSELPLRVDKE